MIVRLVPRSALADSLAPRDALPRVIAQEVRNYRTRAELGETLRQCGGGQRLNPAADREAQYEAERDLADLGFELTRDGELVPWEESC